MTIGICSCCIIEVFCPNQMRILGVVCPRQAFAGPPERLLLYLTFPRCHNSLQKPARASHEVKQVPQGRARRLSVAADDNGQLRSSNNNKPSGAQEAIRIPPDIVEEIRKMNPNSWFQSLVDEWEAGNMPLGLPISTSTPTPAAAAAAKPLARLSARITRAVPPPPPPLTRAPRNSLADVYGIPMDNAAALKRKVACDQSEAELERFQQQRVRGWALSQTRETYPDLEECPLDLIEFLAGQYPITDLRGLGIGLGNDASEGGGVKERGDDAGEEERMKAELDAKLGLCASYFETDAAAHPTLATPAQVSGQTTHLSIVPLALTSNRNEFHCYC